MPEAIFFVFLIAVTILAIRSDHERYCSTVIVVGKRYVPAEDGAGEIASDEQFLIYVEKTDGTDFFFGQKIYIDYVNKNTFYKIKLGDVIKK